jgi:peptide deformylase
MARLPLHLLGSPVLRQRSDEVETVDDDVRSIVESMFDTMDAAQGVGLAANQVGIARRIAVIDAEGSRIAMINPRIVSTEGRATAEEGCLSIPDVFADVTRSERVVLEALDADGRPYQLEVGALAARAIQHEIDHLDGILFLDHLGPIKRKMLLARWKKDHRNDTTYIKEVTPAAAPSD